MGRLVVWLVPVGRCGFCSVCSQSWQFCLIRQLFGEQQEGSGSSTSAASPSEGEREHPRWMNWESMALFLCAKEMCSYGEKNK